MYHRFNHVDLRGMYNGFLIPNSPRAAPQACGLSPGFNGSGWIVLVFFLTWIIHQYHLFEDIFLLFVCRSLPLAHLVVIACVCCVQRWEIYSLCWLLCEDLKESDHWLLHLILGKSKCEKFLLKQYLYDQVGSRMFMKAVCHITCNLQSMKCCISYFSMLPGGKKCQNYLALHLFRNTWTWQIKASKPYMSLCPRSPREMRNLCVLYSPSL